MQVLKQIVFGWEGRAYRNAIFRLRQGRNICGKNNKQNYKVSIDVILKFVSGFCTCVFIVNEDIQVTKQIKYSMSLNEQRGESFWLNHWQYDMVSADATDSFEE